MTINLTILGCSGSYASAENGPASSYLLQTEGTKILLDAGSGSYPNLCRTIDPRELSAIVLTHWHADHCSGILDLAVAFGYYLPDPTSIPVYAPAGMKELLAQFVEEIGDILDWHEVGEDSQVQVGDIGLRFLATDHPIPTVAVECSKDDRRFVYTSDTGPQWSPATFGPGANLVLSEATFQRERRPNDSHLTARQAAEFAREARAERLMLTHIAPTLDREHSRAEATAAFGSQVELASELMRVEI